MANEVLNRVANAEDVKKKVEEGGEFNIALDLEISPELRREGLAREVINRVQGLRKDRGLDLDDRIHLSVAAEGELADATGEHWALIAGEVLAVGASPTDSAPAGEAAAFDVEGTAMTVHLEKA